MIVQLKPMLRLHFDCIEICHKDTKQEQNTFINMLSMSHSSSICFISQQDYIWIHHYPVTYHGDNYCFI